ncbi:phosphotransferase [Candidatus Bipolaricaulota bacterium]
MSANISTVLPKTRWAEPGWMDRVSAWIHTELETRGIRVVDSIEQPHVRPWSAVLSVPTSEGTFFFKACAEVLVHEVAVTQALSQWKPDCSPKILASDPERGWMLMADGGTTVREAIKADGDMGHWDRLLPRYAQLQIDLASRVDDLLKQGLPNRLLPTLPGQIETLLGDKDMLLIDQPEGLTSAEHERLIGMKEHLEALCDQLAALPVPESIHHGDFHDANIFLDGGLYVFFDWGDSSAAHPFFSLRTAFVIIEYFQGYKEGSPELAKLRDAYLGPWRQYGSREELVAIFDLSARLSPLTSALGWNRVVSSLDPSLRADYVGAVPSLLQEFLELEDKGRQPSDTVD